MKTLNVRYIIGAVAAIVIIALLVANYGMTASIYKTMNQTVKETVQVEMQNLLGDYTPEQVIKTLEQTSTEDINAGVLSQIDYLTDEDKADIVEGVLGVLKPTLLEKLSSSEEAVREDVLTSLENTITEKVNTVIENSEIGSTTLTSEEKTILTDSIVSIVESQILKTLSDETSTTTNTLNTLEKHVQENVTKIETTLNTYKTEITELQKTIETIEKELSSQGTMDASKVEEMSKQLTELKSKYNTLVDQYSGHASNALMVSNIITNLSTKPSSNMVLSAEAGYTMNNQLTKVTERLTNFQSDTTANFEELGIDINTLREQTQQKLNTLRGDLDDLKEETTNNIEEINRKKADLSSLQETNDKLEAASSQIAGVKSDMEQQIANVQSSEEATRNLQIKAIMKSEVERAIDTLNGAISDAGENATEDIKEARNNLNDILAKLEGNSDEVTVAEVQNALDMANQAIANNQSAISQKITSIEQNIKDLDNNITNLSGKVGVNTGDIETLKRVTGDQTTAITQAQSDINTNQSKISLAEADIATNKGKIEQAEANISTLQLEKDNIKAAIDNMDALQTNIANANSDDLDTYIANLENLKTTFSSEADVAQIDAVIANIKNLKELQEAGTATAGELTSAKSALEGSINEAKNTLNGKISEIENNITTINQTIETAKSSIDENKTAISNAREEISNAKSTIANNTNAITQNTNNIASLQSDLNTKASQQDLKDLKDGLDNGAKTTYTFSGSGSDATVTITVPAQ